jgi:hypothetical protein
VIPAAPNHRVADEEAAYLLVRGCLDVLATARRFAKPRKCDRAMGDNDALAVIAKTTGPRQPRRITTRLPVGGTAVPTVWEFTTTRAT